MSEIDPLKILFETSKLLNKATYTVIPECADATIYE